MTEDEVNLVIGAINGFYGPTSGGLLDKNNFTNFLSKGNLAN